MSKSKKRATEDVFAKFVPEFDLCKNFPVSVTEDESVEVAIFEDAEEVVLETPVEECRCEPSIKQNGFCPHTAP